LFLGMDAIGGKLRWVTIGGPPRPKSTKARDKNQKQTHSGTVSRRYGEKRNVTFRGGKQNKGKVIFNDIHKKTGANGGTEGNQKHKRKKGPQTVKRT